jgi:hypothetical protein
MFRINAAVKPPAPWPPFAPYGPDSHHRRHIARQASSILRAKARGSDALCAAAAVSCGINFIALRSFSVSGEKSGSLENRARVFDA